MGLYLCIFDNNEEEIEGMEIGRYEYFGMFRDRVATYIENDEWGSICTTLMSHSDCDGIWTPEDCKHLLKELELIKNKFKQLPIDKEVKTYKLAILFNHDVTPKNLYECFVDTDGENLIERLEDLCKISIESGLDIEFQ
ncbi:Imm70 family immunity protein [Fusobacterium sp. PH5-44]|uniref:Imm70 family immunity protein n=1 Tax=unclassified Fusobacterium TaxID=2648384 RepID=UPI003D1934DF